MIYTISSQGPFVWSFFSLPCTNNNSSVWNIDFPLAESQGQGFFFLFPSVTEWSAFPWMSSVRSGKRLLYTFVKHCIALLIKKRRRDGNEVCCYNPWNRGQTKSSSGNYSGTPDLTASRDWESEKRACLDAHQGWSETSADKVFESYFNTNMQLRIDALAILPKSWFCCHQSLDYLIVALLIYCIWDETDLPCKLGCAASWVLGSFLVVSKAASCGRFL